MFVGYVDNLSPDQGSDHNQVRDSSEATGMIGRATSSDMTEDQIKPKHVKGGWGMGRGMGNGTHHDQWE